MTPDTAFFRFLQHVKAIFEAKEGGDPWYYGLGYDSWAVWREGGSETWAARRVSASSLHVHRC